MHSDLLDQIGYRLPDVGPVRAGVKRIAASKASTAVLRSILDQVDHVALRLSGGRTTATTALTGLPVLFLTTTGAKSGLPRTAPLFGIPIDGSLGLIGSNFGGPSHPGWVHNLMADPRARVRYRRSEVEIRADLADGDATEQIWATAIQMYPGYAAYRAKAPRSIRVFVARPA